MWYTRKGIKGSNPFVSARNSPRVCNEVAHDQYADEQLANPQKRIYLIEFLHLGLIIVHQGQGFVSATNIEHPVVIPRDVLFRPVSGSF